MKKFGYQVKEGHTRYVFKFPNGYTCSVLPREDIGESTWEFAIVDEAGKIRLDAPIDVIFIEEVEIPSLLQQMELTPKDTGHDTDTSIVL